MFLSYSCGLSLCEYSPSSSISIMHSILCLYLFSIRPCWVQDLCNGQWLTQPRCCAPSPVFLFLSFSLSISAPCVTGCRPAASLSYFQGNWGDSFLMRSFSIQAAQLNSGRKCGCSISRIGWKTSQLWLLYQCLVCDLQSLLYAHWLFVRYVMSQSMRGWGE